MNPMICRCGVEMWLSDDGTTHHWGDTLDDIDHDLDADHVAIEDDDADS